MNAVFQFVCKPCADSAEAKRFGEKKHRKAGCQGHGQCDCQHREPRG